MHKPVDHTGRRFGRLVAVKLLPRAARTPVKWECLCDCGNVAKVFAQALVSGNTKSCGCYAREIYKSAPTRHGGKRSAEYIAWKGMWQRCTNTNHPNNKLYASRTPPDDWKDFSVFLEDMGKKPDPTFTLERIDNSKPYGKDNCKWATRLEQAQNTKNTIRVNLNGKVLSLSAACKELGFNFRTVLDRVNRGWTLSDALTKPVRMIRK